MSVFNSDDTDFDAGPVPDQQADPGEPVAAFTGNDMQSVEEAPSPVTNNLPAKKDAVPVNERASESHNTRAYSINATSMLVGRRAGRKYVVLSVPTTFNGSTNANGVQVSDTRAYIDANAGYQLNPGDSLEIDSEAPVWVGVLSGNTTGVIQWCECFDPQGGRSDP